MLTAITEAGVCVARQTREGQEGPEPSEESALAAMQIDKMSARQLLAQSLPVPSSVLANHQAALVQTGVKARNHRLQVRAPGSPLTSASPPC
jgi:hypothetical protein